MIWYFVLALFWTCVILYIIGLTVGIVKFEHNDTQIHFGDDEVKENSAQQERQQEDNFEDTSRANLDAM